MSLIQIEQHSLGISAAAQVVIWAIHALADAGPGSGIVINRLLKGA